MTNEEFAAWRPRYFRSRLAAAKALDLDRETIAALESGYTRKGNPFPVPRHTALACAAWAIGWREFDGTSPKVE